MSDEKIVLIASAKFKPESVEEAKKAALEIVAASRAEAGCINYDVHQSVEDETILFWHETWANKQAIDEHFETIAFKNFMAKVQPLLAEPSQINLTKMISEKA